MNKNVATVTSRKEDVQRVFEPKTVDEVIALYERGNIDADEAARLLFIIRNERHGIIERLTREVLG